ncbi:MAG TPA: hypothetical protein VKB38_11235 [Terracidiphilus sp.]|nr:hypothetical protein [Terracidiphilus sp.]
MPRHSKLTTIALAVLAALTGSLLHEGLGHGVTAWLRGDHVTELTSNHLNAIRDDRLVDAAGTLVNFIAGFILLFASRAAASRATLRYFLWILATLNLLHAAGYFLFSGALNVGDWAQVIARLPHPGALRTAMAVTGAMLYVVFLRLLIRDLRPFCPERSFYNTVARLPYLAACIYMCIAGALDPLGWKLMLLSTLPAWFGGLSGLLWGDVFLIGQPAPAQPLTIRRSPVVIIAAAVLGLAFLFVVAPGVEFHH